MLRGIRDNILSNLTPDFIDIDSASCGVALESEFPNFISGSSAAIHIGYTFVVRAWWPKRIPLQFYRCGSRMPNGEYSSGVVVLASGWKHAKKDEGSCARRLNLEKCEAPNFDIHK